MADRRTSDRFRRQGPKRGNLWLPFAFAVTVTASGSNNNSTLLGRYLTEHGAEVPVGTTLGPIRGQFSVKAVTDTAVDIQAMCAMYLQPEGGLTAVPSLESEQIDGMWYQAVNGHMVLGNGQPFIDFTINTRAMRKVNEIGQELVFQCDEFGGETNIELLVGGHIFMKLP